MASIDQRIVSMVFENAKFEQGIKQSMDSLKKFNDALSKTGQTTGFADIDKAASKVTLTSPMKAIGKLQGYLGQIGTFAAGGFSAIDKAGAKVSLTEPITALNKVNTAVGDVGRNAPEAFGTIDKAAGKVDFAGLSSGLDNIQTKFSTMGAAAAVALGNIASKVVEVGTLGTKSLAIDPVTEGFHNYETQIDAVQTILANTGLKGKAGLGQITSTLNDLNKYANLTVYNFSEMAHNIGTFTAAGVQLKPATAAIKGIANLGAMSGSSSQQVSTAMYQLSQALAAGKVGLQDWNSVVNANMGGQVFQKALANTAKNMGTLSGRTVEFDKATHQLKIGGETFRESMQSGMGKPPPWLTSQVLLNTLKQFTGDMTNAQLKSQGFTKSQVAAIQAQAKLAVNSATQIKTVTQLFQALREEVGTAWATVWKSIFGDINQAKALLSPLHTAIENALTIPIYNFNKVLQGWSKMGGRVKLLDALKQGITDIKNVIQPVQKAFRDIFPAQTPKGLLDMTNGFAHLMKALEASPETMTNIRHTFDGFFALLHIGWTIIKNVGKVLGDLLGFAGKGAGGILNFTGGLGLFLKSLDEAISKGHALDGFFRGLGASLSIPFKVIKALGSAFMSLFHIGNFNDASKSLDSVGNSFDTLKKKGGPVVDVIVKIANAIGTIQNWLAPVVQTLTTEIGHLFTTLADHIRNANFDNIGSILTAGLMAGIFGTLKKGFSGGLSVYVNSFSDVLKGLSGVFNGLTAQLKAMQRAVVSTTILKIAVAIGILAASTYVLSTIDAQKLAQSMAAIAIGMGELVGVMKLMEGSVGGGKFAGLKMGGMASSLVILATALVILAGAMKLMASMSWNELAKGLTGIGGGLAILAGAMFLFSKTGGGGFSLIATGIGLEFVATSLVILAAAAKAFSSMSWTDIAKGLVGMLGALLALNVGVIGLGPELLLVGPGLLVTAIAVTMLSGAVAAFGRIPLKNLILGILGMGAAIAMLAYEIEMIPPTVAAQGAGLILLSIGLEGIAGVIGTLGKMNIFTLIKGIIAMGAALAVLGAGLFALEVGGGGASAIALLGIAAALAILAPTLAFLGTLKWSTIGKGLAAIAALLTVLAIAGAVAAAPIAALGAALLPWGIVLLQAAAAIFLFAKAMSYLGKDGTKGVGIFIGAMTAFIALIPHMILGMVTGILEGLKQFSKIMPMLVDAIAKMVTSIINMLAKNIPVLGQAIEALLLTFVKIMTDVAPKVYAAGLKLMAGFLKALAGNITDITKNAALVILRFLNALDGHARDIGDAGGKVLAHFLEGIGKRAFRIGRAAAGVLAKFEAGLYTFIPQLIKAGTRVVVDMIKGMGRGAVRVANVATHAMLSFLSAVENDVPKVVKKGVHVARVFVEHISKGLVKLADIGAQGVIGFINGLARVIRHRGPQLRKAAWNLVSAIVDGMLDGFKDLWHKVEDKMKSLADHVPGIIKKAWKVLSPSKVFHEIGGYAALGLANGIHEGGKHVVNASETMGNDVIKSMRKTMTNVPGLLDGIVDKDPKIKPVLDLSAVKKGAGEIGQHLSAKPLAVDFSAHQAGAISREKTQTDQAHAEAVAAAATSSMHFEQNNYSPEALSTAEIYRRTNNQISQARKALGLPTGEHTTKHRKSK